MHLMGHLQPTQLFFWPGGGREPRSLGWYPHFQRRGHEWKCVAMVADPKKPLGRQGDPAECQAVEQCCTESWRAAEQGALAWPPPFLINRRASPVCEPWVLHKSVCVPSVSKGEAGPFPPGHSSHGGLQPPDCFIPAKIQPDSSWGPAR